MSRTNSPRRVYFDCGFGSSFHRPYERAAQEYPIHQSFQWKDRRGYLLAAYEGAFGLTMDLGFEVDIPKIRAFFVRWRNQERVDSLEEQEQMERENPFTMDLQAKVKCGRFWLTAETCFAESWSPCWPQGERVNDRIVKQVMRYYGCDPRKGWIFYRLCFPWKTKRKPQWKDLRLCLHKVPGWIAGRHFAADKAGQEFSFIHPVTGKKHTLTVVHLAWETLEENVFEQDDFVYPRFFMQLDYTIIPELVPGTYSLQDTNCSDAPRKKIKEKTPKESGKAKDLLLPEAQNAVVIGVIQSADGPTCVWVGTKENPPKPSVHTVCSSLYFVPPQQIEWRMVFEEPEWEDCILNEGITKKKKRT